MLVACAACASDDAAADGDTCHDTALCAARCPDVAAMCTPLGCARAVSEVAYGARVVSANATHVVWVDLDLRWWLTPTTNGGGGGDVELPIRADAAHLGASWGAQHCFAAGHTTTEAPLELWELDCRTGLAVRLVAALQGIPDPAVAASTRRVVWLDRGLWSLDLLDPGAQPVLEVPETAAAPPILAASANQVSWLLPTQGLVELADDREVSAIVPDTERFTGIWVSDDGTTAGASRGALDEVIIEQRRGDAWLRVASLPEPMAGGVLGIADGVFFYLHELVVYAATLDVDAPASQAAPVVDLDAPGGGSAYGAALAGTSLVFGAYGVSCAVYAVPLR